MIGKLTVVLVLHLTTLVVADDVIVTLPIGQLKGRTEYSLRGISFYAFQSIPYGKAPVGDLRFKEPQAADKWNGVYDATKLNGPICYQIGATTGETESEDCLYLNVYTPEYPNSNASLPVMVYIHGGAFLNGHSNFYGAGPHYLMESGIIVVTVLYRLGPFGFMATGDTAVPGNMGLKDQTLGLKWVQDNIKYFGGDPTKVTLNGQSAGGASVTYHTLSPKSAGLFRGVIAESGSALNGWTYNRNYKENAYQLAKNLGHPLDPATTTTQQLVDYLRTVPADDLRKASSFEWTMANNGLLQGFDFTPVIEPEYDGAFLTERMYGVIAEGRAHKVPMMMGVNSEEEISVAATMDTLKWMSQTLDGNLSYTVSNNMHLSDPTQLNAAGAAIRNIYTNETFQSHLGSAVKFYSDTSFTRGVIHHAKLQSQYSDVWFYIFSYHGQLGNNNVTIDGADRVGHGEEMIYIWVWGNYSVLNNYPASDIQTSDRLRGFVTNFVKTLNPTPEKSDLFQNIIWPKVTADNYQYMNINETLSVEVNPKGDAYSGWVKAYETYAVKPYDTF